MASALESLADAIPALLTSDRDDDVAALAQAFRQVATWLDALAQMPPPLRRRLWPAIPVADAPPVVEAPTGVVPPSPPRTAPEPSAPPAPAPTVFPGHRFHRALRGGYLSNGVRIPESAVRQHDLRTGDHVVATQDPRDPVPGRYYVRRVARDADPAARERCEIPMVLIEADEGTGRLVARKSLGDGARFDPPLLLPEDDVQHLGLQAGDVVDLAYWADGPTAVSVSWHHRGLASLPPEPDPLPAPAITSPPKPIKTTGRKVSQKAAPLPVLAGHRVLVVGCAPKHPEYQEAVEAHAGQFEGFSGDEGQDRLESAVKRADVVVILTGMASHHAMNDAKRFAKKHGVAYRLCGSFGIQTVVDRAAKALSKQQAISF